MLLESQAALLASLNLQRLLHHRTLGTIIDCWHPIWTTACFVCVCVCVLWDGVVYTSAVCIYVCGVYICCTKTQGRHQMSYSMALLLFPLVTVSH